MTFSERDVRLMVADLAVTRGRVRKRTRVRELAASHKLEQMRRVCMYVCMYGHHIYQSMDQPGKAANPACGQLNRENEYSPVPMRA